MNNLYFKEQIFPQPGQLMTVWLASKKRGKP